jgi:hypothetical protein
MMERRTLSSSYNYDDDDVDTDTEDPIPDGDDAHAPVGKEICDT